MPVINAAPVGPKYRPAFTVEKLTGSFKKLMYKKTKHGLEREEVEAPRGWLVTFPARGNGLLGQSIHVETKEEMARQGFDQTVVPLVDEDGEVVGHAQNVISVKKGGHANA